MTLSVRPKIYSLPSYSLTGDLIGFLRCGLQYRYTKIGRLPPARPVQLWFGEFIHGVLEEAYRRHKDETLRGASRPFPWPPETIEEIRTLIKARLAARGLVAWDEILERTSDARAETAINDLGPHLFPIIHRAEVRLYGARMLPPIEEAYKVREADRYEMVGIVDVVTHLELNDPAHRANPLVQHFLKTFATLPPPKFELVIDYKGMRRPPNLGLTKGSLWEQYAWQVQTYAELRRKQTDAFPVAAGVLLYVNELHPTSSDLESLKREVNDGLTDVRPAPGSAAERLLKEWTPGKPLPNLPLEFRLARAIRVVPVTYKSVAQALDEFDRVVKRIETCRGKEIVGGSVIDSWERNSNDESSCTVCDSRTFCPDYQAKFARKHGELRPRLPAVRSKGG